ncbi:hypothetical protein [Brevibacillus migulae]|uniref:hypothetical protein n=1 Tax=Brevibacillus migulae TaxID=1644114 RepID=UPI00106EA14A|nr:hypothetical protein [Brevibacillus migulae]
MIRFTMLLLLFTLLLPATAPSAIAKGPWDDQLQQDIAQWMRTISAQDAGFASWRNATPTVRTLGTNQHQWLVTLTTQGKEVGYMVVAELPEKTDNKNTADAQKFVFVLLEYGSGEYLLFDETLAPPDEDAVPVYDGFSSFWKVNKEKVTHYIDAKTGERYPTTFQPDPEMIVRMDPRDLATAEKRLVQQRSFSSVEENPFDHIDWLPAALAEPPTRTAVSWKSLMDRQEPRSAVLTVSLFHDQVTSPFSIGSVHVWNEDVAYVGIWNEGLRFLPFSYASEVGRIVN